MGKAGFFLHSFVNDQENRYPLIFFIAFFIIFYSCNTLLSSEYFSIEEYVKIHPEQKVLMDNFTRVVKGKGIPIKDNIQKKRITISFIYPGEQVSDYWRRSILSFKARMNEIGIDYKINEYFSKPVVDARIQERQIRSALKTDPDYLVFTLDVKKHKRIIERIITKRRPRIILQNITTPLKSWEGTQPFLYVGFDHATGSKHIADYFLNKAKKRGRYALLYFSQGYVSEMRGESVVKYLREKSDLRLMSSYYTNGDRLKSKNAVFEILKDHNNLQFIFACSTDVALGAIDALSERKVENILINGWGGGSSELEAIEKRKMDVTVMRMNDDNGVAMAEAIRLSIEGKRRKVPVVFSGDFALIKKGISKQSLEKLKQQAFRYSGLK